LELSDQQHVDEQTPTFRNPPPRDASPSAEETLIATCQSTFTVTNNTPCPQNKRGQPHTSTTMSASHLQPTCLPTPTVGVKFSESQRTSKEPPLTDSEEKTLRSQAQIQQDSLNSRFETIISTVPTTHPCTNTQCVATPGVTDILMNESLLTIVSTMEKISVSHDLPYDGAFEVPSSNAEANRQAHLNHVSG
jgi:hypothetical protein